MILFQHFPFDQLFGLKIFFLLKICPQAAFYIENYVNCFKKVLACNILKLTEVRLKRVEYTKLSYVYS